IEDLELQIAINSEWQTGMSSSIKTGLARLLEIEPDLEAALITLMDQTLITSKHLAQFVERFNADGPPIIAAAYDGVAGVPALFSHKLYDELRALKGEKGARAVIRARENVVTIDLKEAIVDIDNMNDLLKIRTE
ncbi:MAG: nucleotidyltransferase family protein, partial [Pyrinomonadaceae bacterium]